jgi:hypothetical protein
MRGSGGGFTRWRASPSYGPYNMELDEHTVRHILKQFYFLGIHCAEYIAEKQ